MLGCIIDLFVMYNLPMQQVSQKHQYSMDIPIFIFIYTDK